MAAVSRRAVSQVALNPDVNIDGDLCSCLEWLA